MWQTGRWILLLAAVVALFFWKILFTNQFAIIVGWEGTNQAYAWYSFAVKAIQQGVLPLWNPYTLSGHTYLGEPQTSLFYPFKLFMYLWPLGASGVLSERIFHESYVLAHFLAACFMFFFAREVGIKDNFAAFVAAACFTFGGMFGKLGWVNLTDSGVWLPLIFLFLLRAFRSESNGLRVLNACYCGLCMAMAILAGSLHMPLMDVIVVVSASFFFAWQPSGSPMAHRPIRSRLIWTGIFIFVVGIVSFAAASLQLLPSAEYAPLARRWTGEWSGLFGTRIPYVVTTGENGIMTSLGPRSIFAFLFGGAGLGGGEFSTYFGVMPLLLTVIGLWRNWEKPWIRYLAGLGMLAWFYAIGSYSFLHGLLYVLIPLMDKAWESGRFLYLTHFATALLAGFGAQTLFSGDPRSENSLYRINRILQWIVIVLALALGIPALLGKPDVVEWSYATFFFVITTWGLFVYIIRGNRAGWARFLLVAVILCDLNVMTWQQGLENKMIVRKNGPSAFDQMMSVREAADFIKSRPGLYRVDLEGGSMPSSMGDVWGVQTTDGWGGTMLDDYLPVRWSPNGSCLLNVRYILGSAKDTRENPIFTGHEWKVYEKPSYCPRAWVVRSVEVEPSHEKLIERIKDGKFDPLRVAMMSERPEVFQENDSPDTSKVSFQHYEDEGFELTVKAHSAGLLVLSEIYYPGWEATVNGKAAHIYKVDGLLRGIVVSGGENHIVMRYSPLWIRVGSILTALAFLGTILLAFLFRKQSSKTTAGGHPPESSATELS